MARRSQGESYDFDKIDEAIRELKMILSMEPRHEQARQLSATPVRASGL